MIRHTSLRFSAWLIACALCVVLLKFCYGAPIFLVIAGMLVCLWLGVREVLPHFRQKGRQASRSLQVLGRITLSLVSILFVLALFEVFLRVRDSRIAHSIQKGAAQGSSPSALTIPKEWEERPAQVPGAQRAYYWHGKLHVFDANGMRRSTPFPPKRADTFRIMVVGDSLTYGVGVDEEETYGSVIERQLGKDYRVEVLNLGVCGFQSADVKNIVARYLPLLEPDLVVYGVCTNDFLPSGARQYDSNTAWAIPLPHRVKQYFLVRTLTGRIFERCYNALLMRLGMRMDFAADVLRDYQSTRQRFAADIHAMNELVRERHLPPVVAMVLLQCPRAGSNLNKIAAAAEEYLRDAGMTVVPFGNYFRQYDGKDLRVSAWEGHPSAEGHRIFADNILPVLRALPSLQAFRKSNSTSGDNPSTEPQKTAP
jgi:lysophospholipase L1-like esterase